MTIGVDCIDRQATLDAIIKRLGIKNETYLLEAERVIYQQILAMPSVTPEPKTGHWIEYTRVLIPEPFNNWEQAWYCSECGYGNQECEDGGAWLGWAYCPYCGAKMVESQENEDNK